jgi:hypothetical protein
MLDRGGDLVTGGAAELALADHVDTTLRAAGFETFRQPVEAPGFAVRQALVEIAGGSVPVAPQAVVAPTGPAGVAAPLSLWRHADDSAAARGAIAVVMLPFARHSRLGAPVIRQRLDAAVAAGAAAVVLVTDGPTGETLWLNSDGKPPAPVPVAVVGPKPGAPLIEAAVAGAAGRLVIDGDAFTARSANVWGRIGGRGPALVVSTPRTGWTRCVAERGPGLATFLALARWAPAALPANDLVFLTTTAHEYDNAGGLRFLEELAPPPASTALWTHLGAGFAARDFHELGGWQLRPLPGVDSQRYLVGTDGTLPVLRAAFAGEPGLENAYSSSAGSAGELQEILGHGYSPCFGMYGAHRFHHAVPDRLDKADPAHVRRAALAVRRSIVELLGAGA